MRQAITTEEIAPAGTKLTKKVRARAKVGSVFVDWDDRLSEDENHMRAARKLAQTQGWTGIWEMHVTCLEKRVFVHQGVSGLCFEVE